MVNLVLNRCGLGGKINIHVTLGGALSVDLGEDEEDEGEKNTIRSFVQNTQLDRICKIIVVINQVNRTNRFWRIHLKTS